MVVKNIRADDYIIVKLLIAGEANVSWGGPNGSSRTAPYADKSRTYFHKKAIATDWLFIKSPVYLLDWWQLPAFSDCADANLIKNPGRWSGLPDCGLPDCRGLRWR